jgi:hypothetical protein
MPYYVHIRRLGRYISLPERGAGGLTPCHSLHAPSQGRECEITNSTHRFLCTGCGAPSRHYRTVVLCERRHASDTRRAIREGRGYWALNGGLTRWVPPGVLLAGDYYDEDASDV